MTYQRITSGYMNENVLNNLVTNRDLLMELQKKIASGREFERASEDVFSATTVLKSNTSIGKLETFLKNINNARSEIETANKAILTTLDTVHKARELTIQALNATSGSNELNIIGSQMEQLTEQIKDVANTKYGTKFIFGGQNTSSAPFTIPTTGEVQYNGSADGTADRNTEIAEGVTIAVNMPGDDVFGYYYTGDHDNNPVTPDTLEGQGLLRTMIMLTDELKQADPDKNAIRDRLKDLDTDMANLLESQSTLGGILARLDITEKIHKDDKINLIDSKSKVQDVDFAKAISDLKYQETALKASLQVSARIIQPSIMNFL